MISTVTTATVTTVTMAGSLAAVSVLTLLCLSIVKEVTTAAEGERMQALGRALNIAIVPLVLAFVLIAAASVHQVLR